MGLHRAQELPVLSFAILHPPPPPPHGGFPQLDRVAEPDGQCMCCCSRCGLPSGRCQSPCSPAPSSSGPCTSLSPNQWLRCSHSLRATWANWTSSSDSIHPFAAVLQCAAIYDRCGRMKESSTACSSTQYIKPHAAAGSGAETPWQKRCLAEGAKQKVPDWAIEWS